ncbi:cytochrome D ubiquinol oxidase subunit II [Bacteroidia bacterium]|nr:cytochrome D ubiquinol oxidase subunit II [Bacteroidia bacterium]GHV45385.1 cytochrome D ubiquinol oxidase subunit II [Bacteroidia bacterium]
MITYEFLQNYWWLIVSLLGGILVFLLFVQGGQTFLFSLAKNDDERKLLVNVLGRKWEFTFTTLVTFGGAFFASFPLFYSTSFGGAYWVWILILLCFVLQAVSYEYQSKPGNIFGKKTYQSFLFINGLLGTILLGTAVATFFTGSNFVVNKMNLVDFGGNNVVSQWGTPFHGLEAALNVQNLCLGVAVFFLARTLALLFFINRVDNANIQTRAHKQMWVNAIVFVVFFLAFVIWTLLSEGFAINAATGEVYLEKYKYFLNLWQMPVVLVLFLAGVVAVLYGIIATLLCNGFRKGIWYAGIGTVVTVTMLLLIAGYNNTAFYPALPDLQSSLTIRNASSSEFTLRAMFYVSFLIPFVLAYIVWAWRKLENKQTDIKEVKEEEHSY